MYKLDDYIEVIDDALPVKILANMVKVFDSWNFNDAQIIGGGKDKVIKEIRNTQNIFLNQEEPGLTKAHWANYLRFRFNQYINFYQRKHSRVIGEFVKGISDVQALKYEPGGHYKYHVDMATTVPRTLSLILMCNNDYEGGELCFKWDQEQVTSIETKANRIIIWPSNFQYPHTVKPVKKGTRYSVVAWAV